MRTTTSPRCGDGAFWQAFGTTAIFVAVAVGLELLIGLAIALSLQKQRWASDLTRSMLLAPMFITPIAVGLIFRFLLNDQIGAIPHLLHAIGVDYDFFGPGRALFTLAFIDVWQWTPFMVLLLLAGPRVHSHGTAGGGQSRRRAAAGTCCGG